MKKIIIVILSVGILSIVYLMFFQSSRLLPFTPEASLWEPRPPSLCGFVIPCSDMEQGIIEVKEGETKTFGDLTITNRGGGHEILENVNGGRGGDESFANINLQTPRAKSSVSDEGYLRYKGGTLTFDNYVITVQEISWNAKSVIFQIKKLQ